MTPPTMIVVHPKEKRRKCTVEVLRRRADFVFRRYPDVGESPPAGYVRLGLGGIALSTADRGCGLLVLDGTWRLAERMEQDFARIPVRTLPPWKSAYPRTSKLFDDPHGGLATIEAIYAACHILGRDVSGLLDAYHWRDEFLALNAERISDSEHVE
ncbi:MAG: hypothetical protein AB7U20_17095 [Planctomycetaceae bacterium]